MILLQELHVLSTLATEFGGSAWRLSATTILRNGFCRNLAEEGMRKPQYRLECGSFAPKTVFTDIVPVSNENEN
jgi:hypothetical protein